MARNFLFIFAALTAVFGLVSCESLPPGVAPDGLIVENTAPGKESLTRAEAIDKMSTRLGMTLVGLGSPALSLDSQNDEGLGQELLDSLVSSKLAKPAASDDSKAMILHSRVNEAAWTVQLLPSLRPGPVEPLWTGSVELHRQ